VIPLGHWTYLTGRHIQTDARTVPASGRESLERERSMSKKAGRRETAHRLACRDPVGKVKA
jgi:hypothetical protein